MTDPSMGIAALDLSPRIVFSHVHDPQDEPTTQDLVRTLHRPDHGQVVCEVRPGGRRLERLAGDMAAALGKRPQMSGSWRHSQVTWRYVTAAVIAGDLQRLIVMRAHLLSEGEVRALFELATSCGVELIVITHGERMPRATRENLRNWGFQAVKLKSFLAAKDNVGQAPSPKSRAVSSGGDDWSQITLPRDNFVTFRASCRGLLSAEEFTLVDAQLRTARAETEAWCEAAQQIGEESISAFLRQLVGRAAHQAEALTTIRGAQVCLFHRGFLLKVDATRFQASIESQVGLERADDLAAACVAYLNTSYPAAAALALISGELSMSAVAALNIEDVAADHAVALDCESRDVPAALRPSIAAHVIARRLEGADDRDPLFVAEGSAHATANQPYERMTARGIGRNVRAVAAETGIPLVARYTLSASSQRSRWALRAGVSVQSLGVAA